MTEQDPIQEMIDQLQKLVKQVEDKKFQFPDTPLPGGIDQMLDDLETQVSMFAEVTNETLKELGLSEEEIQKRLKKPPKGMSVKEKRRIRELNYLRKNAEEIKFTLGVLSRHARKTLESPSKPKTKKQKRIKKHKKRYKGLRNEDKWKQV